jgi:hypothetical protein
MRALCFSIAPLVPAKSTVFPFALDNPVTPVIDPDLRSGDVDPTENILTSELYPLAFYRHSGPATVVLHALSDRVASTVRFELR